MKHILTHTDETLFAKKFGYNNVEKFTKTKTLFLECESIQEWLLKGHYDMVNSSLEFIQKFDFILDKEILNSFFNQSVLLKDKYKKITRSKSYHKNKF